MASFLAICKFSNNSESFSTIFIPFPPPPPAALIRTGYPILLAISLASLISETPFSEPLMTGSPNSLAIFLAWILSPILLINAELGPINLIL